jgi:hypothetical protein
MTTIRGFVVVGVVVGVLVRIAFSLSSLSSSLSLSSSSSSWMISPNFRSGEMRLRDDDDDVRDDEEEENKSTSFCATISATGPQYATSISKLAFVVVSIIVN